LASNAGPARLVGPTESPDSDSDFVIVEPSLHGEPPNGFWVPVDLDHGVDILVTSDG
jgi:hypothetical protein